MTLYAAKLRSERKSTVRPLPHGANAAGPHQDRCPPQRSACVPRGLSSAACMRVKQTILARAGMSLDRGSLSWMVQAFQPALDRVAGTRSVPATVDGPCRLESLHHK